MASTPRDATRKVSQLDCGQNQRPLRSIAALQEQGLTVQEQRQQLERVAEQFSVAITPMMAELIDNETDGPVARQFVPSAAELNTGATELHDPIGDTAHSPVKGIVHRYPDRLLLTPVHVCPVYCRFCFRREQVGNNAADTLTGAELEQALEYIRTHEEVWEVILSGGDPLILSPRRLGQIMDALTAIEHVKVIRIHTRVPVVAPERITPELVSALSGSTATYVVLHTNHVQELTATAIAACAALIDHGIPMLSQTVLLKGINDKADTLEALLRRLVEVRIKPYYLHHGDQARGTAHFRTEVATGQQLIRSLRGRISGLCQPEYVLDIPGGAGKVPLGQSWVESSAPGVYAVTDYRGGVHQYTDNSE